MLLLQPGQSHLHPSISKNALLLLQPGQPGQPRLLRLSLTLPLVHTCNLQSTNIAICNQQTLMLNGDVASFWCCDSQLKGDVASFLSCFSKWMAVIGLEHKKFRIPIILHDNIFLYGKIVPPPKNLTFHGTSSPKIMVVPFGQ